MITDTLKDKMFCTAILPNSVRQKDQTCRLQNSDVGGTCRRSLIFDKKLRKQFEGTLNSSIPLGFLFLFRKILNVDMIREYQNEKI